MKFTTMRAFQKHLEGAEKAGFAALYLVAAAEGGEARVAVDRLVATLKRREGIDAMGVRSLDKPSVSDLEQEINTLSFFASKRIIVVGGADELGKEGEEVILRESVPGVFLILHGKLCACSFYKKLEKQGIVAELGGEKSWEREKNAQEWVLQRVAEEKKRIEPLAAQLLARDTGGDIALLEQEIEKLVVYTAEREMITRQDVTALCVSRPSITAFQLSEALFKRDAALAVRLFRTLLEEGTSYFGILKQLRGQILTDLEIASILKMGGGPAEIIKSYPYIKGFILEKHLEVVRTWGFEGLKRALVLVDDYELRAKEGTSDYELLSDLFLLKIIA